MSRFTFHTSLVSSAPCQAASSFVSAAMVLVLLAHAAPLGKSGNMNGDYLIATGTKMAPKFNNDVSDRP
jgi:hypothetical protein